MTCLVWTLNSGRWEQRVGEGSQRLRSGLQILFCLLNVKSEILILKFLARFHNQRHKYQFSHCIKIYRASCSLPKQDSLLCPSITLSENILSASKVSFQSLVLLIVFSLIHSKLRPEILSFNMTTLRLIAKLGLKTVNNFVRLIINSLIIK